MKTHTIKTPTAELLIVELPRVSYYYLYEDMLYIFDNENDKNYRFKGSYILLGKPDEIREDDAKGLVENCDYYNNFYKGKDYVYKNYGEGFSFPTATESLLSAIESQIYWDVNPVKLFDMDNLLKAKNIAYDEIKKFNEAELRTFDRNRTLIFVKN